MSFPEETEALLSRYRRKGILVDANLLVGYLIGLFDERQLANCRATKNFSRADFQLLIAIVARFEVLVTTPHVLTEVCNLAGRLPASVSADFLVFFADYVERMQERSVPAVEACRHKTFTRLALTDAAIATVATGEYLVLTNDLPLFEAWRSRD